MPVIAAVVMGVTITTTMIVTTIIEVVVSIAMSMVMQMLAPKPKAGVPQDAGTSARQANTRQPITNWPQIYGQYRVGGSITFEHTTNNNKTMHYVLTLCGHSVYEIGSIYFNDILIPFDSTGNAIVTLDPSPGAKTGFAGNVKVYRGLGTTAGDAALISALTTNCPDMWTEAHLQRGRAKIYFVFQYNSTAFSGGFPTVTAVVKGKKVFDYRNLGTSISSSANGTPGVFTTSGAHGLSVGQDVYINGHNAVGGRNGGAIDGNYVINTVPNNNQFTLIDCSYAVPITTGGTGGNVTALSWSANPVLCIRDYLSDRFVGPNVLSSEIDDAGAVVAGANVCETYVALTPNSVDVSSVNISAIAGGSGASVTLSQTGGVVTSATVVAGGHGYIDPQITAPNGVILRTHSSGGVITSVDVAYGGSIPGTVTQWYTTRDGFGNITKVNGVPPVSLLFSDPSVTTGSTTTYAAPSVTITDAGAFASTLTLSQPVAWPTGTLVFLTTTGSLPSGLVTGRPYFTINKSAGGISATTQYALALTQADALNQLPVVLSTSGSGTLTVTNGDAFTVSYTSTPATTLTVAYTSITPPNETSLVYTTGKFAFRTGDKVKVLSTGTLPSGVSNGVTYYWIADDIQHGRLATTLSNANNEVPIVFASNGTGTHIVYATHEQNFTLNGVLDTTKTPASLIQQMLSSMAGKLAWTAGKYVLLPGYYRTPSVTITRDDIIGPIQLQTTTARRDIFNSVKGVYVDPTNSWQPNDFSPVSNTTYVTQDQGIVLWSSLDLSFTDSFNTAQRIAAISLETARRQMTLSLQCKMTMLQTRVGDVVMITDDRYGWYQKTFEIIDWTFAPVQGQAGSGGPSYLGITLFLRETDMYVYTWSSAQATFSRALPKTTLPNPFTVDAPANLTSVESLYTTAGGSSLLSQVTLSWDDANDGMVSRHDAEYSTDSVIWHTVNNPSWSSNSVITTGFKPGTYTFRVHAVNTLGTVSDWTQSVISVLGVSSLPSLNPPGIISISESLITVNSGQGVNSQATIAFSTPSNPDWTDLGVTITGYQIENSLAGSGSWQSIGQCSSSPFQVLGAVGNYDWRIKAFTSLAITTPYSSTFTFELVGLTAPPADIANFSAIPLNGVCYVAWTIPTDLDVLIGGYVLVRYSSLTSGATWEVGTNIGPHFPGSAAHGLLPLMTGTYMAKAVDSTGNYSVNEVSMVAVAPAVSQNSATVFSITESPSFVGVKTNCFATGGELQLQGVENIDDFGNMDSVGLIDYAGGIVSSGEYLFNSTSGDLGGVYTVRINATMTAQALDTGDLFDARTGNIDDWAAMDGNIVNSTNAQIYISTTNDMVTWGPWTSLYTADFQLRDAQFKVILTSGLSTNTVKITSLGATGVFQQTTLNVGANLAVAAGGSSYTYSSLTNGYPFYSAPTINVTPHNMGTGDYYLISSASRTGFTIQFFNSIGVGVARTADIIVVGYGQQVG